MADLAEAFTVYGNYGELLVSLRNGAVLHYEPDPAADAKDNYYDVRWFDLTEYARAYPGEPSLGDWVDIVDIGFWDDEFRYCAPEEDHRIIMGGG